ncbi:MAG TPA: glycosyltransferase family 2 protein [Pyrinomonadaceae bacterium]|nr:glycosyltransferase family 2 protein [Pyrinomonadaceae bacterium]
MFEAISTTAIGDARPDKVARNATTDWPSVSVVIPCFNEERRIAQVIERLAEQYDRNQFEILVLDGRSTDDTRKVVADCIARFAPLRIKLVDNPSRHIPDALNLGIAEARGEVIVRMDAHSLPSENYVRSCVALLRQESVEVVGMPWRISAGAQTHTAQAIALAVAHPFGIGDAQYRLAKSGEPREVDTVPFGVFRKSLWQRLGGFNEALLANEDYDFNYRVRLNGGRVLLDTTAHSIYFARPTLSELSLQYFRYGRWKAQMLKLHPRSMRWRHAAAPSFMVMLICLSLLGIWRSEAWWLLSLTAVAYLLPAFGFAFNLSRRANNYKLLPSILVSFVSIHFGWGSGFWRGLLWPNTRKA